MNNLKKILYSLVVLSVTGYAFADDTPVSIQSEENSSSVSQPVADAPAVSSSEAVDVNLLIKKLDKLMPYMINNEFGKGDDLFNTGSNLDEAGQSLPEGWSREDIIGTLIGNVEKICKDSSDNSAVLKNIDETVSQLLDIASTEKFHDTNPDENYGWLKGRLDNLISTYGSSDMLSDKIAEASKQETQNSDDQQSVPNIPDTAQSEEKSDIQPSHDERPIVQPENSEQSDEIQSEQPALQSDAIPPSDVEQPVTEQSVTEQPVVEQQDGAQQMPETLVEQSEQVDVSEQTVEEPATTQSDASEQEVLEQPHVDEDTPQQSEN